MFVLLPEAVAELGMTDMADRQERRLAQGNLPKTQTTRKKLKWLICALKSHDPCACHINDLMTKDGSIILHMLVRHLHDVYFS